MNKLNSDRWNSGIFHVIRTLMHLIAAASFWYAIQYDFRFVNVPETSHRMGNKFGGKLKYLTVINAIIQAVYFTISLLNDFIGTNEVAPKKLPLIRRFKDNLLATLAFPCAVNVSLTFWTLMAIDRELVFPKILDLYFPSWLNHVMHTNIIVFMFLELCTSFRQYPSRKFGMSVLAVFTALYITWVHIIKYASGVWVYPVLDVMALPQRLIFFAVMVLFSFGLYMLGEFLNEKIWTKEMKLVQSAKKSK